VSPRAGPSWGASLSTAFGSVLAVIEAILRETSEHIDEARACLYNSMQSFHLEGPLRAPPGTRIRPAELHSSICSGIDCLNTAEDELKEALKCVQAALRSLSGVNRRLGRTAPDWLRSRSVSSSGCRNNVRNTTWVKVVGSGILMSFKL
jgi:hypothetical protein